MKTSSDNQGDANAARVTMIPSSDLFMTEATGTNPDFETDNTDTAPFPSASHSNCVDQVSLNLLSKTWETISEKDWLVLSLFLFAIVCLILLEG